MNTQEKIVEALENKRTERVWELIEKSVEEVFKEKVNISEETKEEYFNCEDEINDKRNRFIVFEHDNIEESFFGKVLEGYDSSIISEMADEYFTYEESDGGYDVMVIDMKEMKVYLVKKIVSYDTREVKLK